MTSQVKLVAGGAVGVVLLLLFFLWGAPGRQTGTVQLDAGRWDGTGSSHVQSLSILASALTKYPNASEFVVSYYATQHTQAKLTYNRKAETLRYKTEDGGGSDYSSVREYAIKGAAGQGQAFDAVENWGARLILPTPSPESAPATEGRF